MSSNLFRPLRSVCTAALLALTFATTPSGASAAQTLQVPHALPTDHYAYQPYNFVGRIFDLDLIGFGSGTLIRRHTVVTAGHVVFDPDLGFLSIGTFSRALYQTTALSRDQIVSAQAIAGYQAAVELTGNNANLTAFAQDQGLVLLALAPVDEDWADFTTDPTMLANPANGFVVLGYPGVTFDGRTMAYIVPMSPYIPVGTTLKTGSYENDEYLAEEGMSGGPIFVVPPGTILNTVAATTVGGVPDTSGEFTESFVRAIDKVSGKFLTAAEYTSGLIKKVKVTGPTTVQRGQTYTYTTAVVFSAPTRTTGAKATTNRYPELKLVSNNAGTPTQPTILIKKTSNTTFAVTFLSNLRSGATATFQVFYTKTATPLGKSSITVKIQ